jgi:methylthioribose-1-phosphate isomerase
MTTAAEQTQPLVALRFDGQALHALDQTALPWREQQLVLRDASEVSAAIRRLSIRGAPLIGVAAGYGVALELQRDGSSESLARACETIRQARPTAVNLAHALDRVRDAVLRRGSAEPFAAAVAEARAIEAQEEAASDAIAAAGAELLSSAKRILTHCNTGALAAPGRGTALAVIAELAQRGHLELVIATESRPLLQGARLTTYELSRIPVAAELIVDAAAPGLIASREVDAVIVGCDRVAANGDVANKVGTYALALAAEAARIPFVVAAPTSTLDLESATGAEIVIEARDPDEVRSAAGHRLTTADTPCRNPAFDVTPAALVTALVTEAGVVEPVHAESLSALRRK